MRRSGILLFFVFACAKLTAQLAPLQQKAIVLKRMIEMRHYSPRPVNDSFSATVFKSVIKGADHNRLYFTNEEFKQLQSFQYSLDDELKGSGWGFIDQFSNIYK